MISTRIESFSNTIIADKILFQRGKNPSIYTYHALDMHVDASFCCTDAAESQATAVRCQTNFLSGTHLTYTEI